MSSVEPKARKFRAEWRCFPLGSLPYTDALEAWAQITAHFPHIPGWPQLPRKSHLENMYTQFSERFPGITLDGGNLYVDRRRGLDRGLEALYLAYLEDDVDHGRITGAYAAGLDALRRGDVAFAHAPQVLRGQVMGPVSWGLTIIDQNQRPILYDEVLEDAVGKHLRMKAAWQERELLKLAPQAITVIHEPYMVSFGSAFIGLTRGQVIALFEEVFSGLQGLKGVHCCGNTDWSILLNTSVDILSLDAYDYSQTLVAYAKDLSRFLERGGVIAWGIVPAGIAAESETVESLVGRLEQAMDRLDKAGVSREAMLRSGLVTPSCGLGALRPTLAEHIFDLTAGVSDEMRRRYVGPTTDDAELADVDASDAE